MAYSICTKHYLNNSQAMDDTEYIPQIYTKNSNWNPPPASVEIENQITKFDKSLHSLQNSLIKKYQNFNLNNLTPLPCKTLKELKQNKNIFIKLTDKNLGPAVLDKDQYIQQVLNQHLLTKDYVQLTKQEALSKINLLKDNLKALITNNRNILSKTELTYFLRSLKLHHRIPIFYGLPKVHKTPVMLRPVVSISSSLTSIFSNWLDFKMKTLGRT